MNKKPSNLFGYLDALAWVLICVYGGLIFFMAFV
jgi:hypothetical protein